MSDKGPEVVSRQTAARKIVETANEIHTDIIKKKLKPSMTFPIR